MIFLNDIFNPMAEFVHILPKIGLKQPSIFLSVQLNLSLCCLSQIYYEFWPFWSLYG